VATSDYGRLATAGVDLAVKLMLGALLVGATHVSAGPVQMMSSAIFDNLLFHTCRVSGGIGLPILVHAAWDSSVFTGVTTADPVADPDTSLILFRRSVVALVGLLVGHRTRRTPPPGTALTPARAPTSRDARGGFSDPAPGATPRDRGRPSTGPSPASGQ